MSQLESEPSTPRRSVRELVTFWDARIAAEKKAALADRRPTVRSMADVFEPPARCRLCHQPNMRPFAVSVGPTASQDMAEGRFASDGPGEARLRLNRLPVPFAWGKRGKQRG